MHQLKVENITDFRDNVKTSYYILFCKDSSLGHYKLIEVKTLVLNVNTNVVVWSTMMLTSGPSFCTANSNNFF